MSERLLKPTSLGTVLAVALALACFPPCAWAARVDSMPSGQRDLTPRQAQEAHVSRLLAEQRVAAALASAGLTPDQVRSRLDRLSDEQLGQFAENLETVKAGGFFFIIIPILIIVGVFAVVLSLVQELFP